MAKGRLANGRKQRGLKHNETYRTPIFCIVTLPKVPSVPSKITLARRVATRGRRGQRRSVHGEAWRAVDEVAASGHQQDHSLPEHSVMTYIRVCVHIYIYIYIHISIYIYTYR